MSKGLRFKEKINSKKRSKLRIIAKEGPMGQILGSPTPEEWKVDFYQRNGYWKCQNVLEVGNNTITIPLLYAPVQKMIIKSRFFRTTKRRKPKLQRCDVSAPISGVSHSLGENEKDHRAHWGEDLKQI